MPAAARSFDRLCPGGRPFLCVEEILRDWAVLAQRHLAAPFPTPPGELLFLSEQKHSGAPRLPTLPPVRKVKPSHLFGNRAPATVLVHLPGALEGSSSGMSRMSHLPTSPCRARTSSQPLSAAPADVGPQLRGRSAQLPGSDQ